MYKINKQKFKKSRNIQQPAQPQREEEEILCRQIQDICSPQLSLWAIKSSLIIFNLSIISSSRHTKSDLETIRSSSTPRLSLVWLHACIHGQSHSNKQENRRISISSRTLKFVKINTNCLLAIARVLQHEIHVMLALTHFHHFHTPHSSRKIVQPGVRQPMRDDEQCACVLENSMHLY